MLIICCSPEEAQAQETLSTLKFGECAKRVTTFASANVVAAPDEVAAQLAELRAEVVRLKRQVKFVVYGRQVVGRLFCIFDTKYILRSTKYEKYEVILIYAW